MAAELIKEDESPGRILVVDGKKYRSCAGPPSSATRSSEAGQPQNDLAALT